MGPLDAALNQAAARLKGWAGKVARTGVGVAGVGLSIAGPILAAFKGAVDQAAAMGTLATQIGTTADEASRLAYALGTVGISEEEIVQFSRHLSSAFSSAADGSHEAVQSFARLGLAWQDLAKMSPAEQMIAVKEAIGGVPNAFDRSTQAAHFFGRRGLEFAKLSAEEIRKRMAEAGDVGAVVSPEQAAQAKEIRRSFMQIGAAMKYAFVEVGRALLPHHEAIKEYSRAVVSVARTVREWVAGNKALVLGVLGVGVAVTAAGVALVALGVIGASVAGVFSGIAAVAGAVFSPVGLVVLGLAAGWALAAVNLHHFVTQTELGRRAFAPLAAEGKKAWAVVKESALAASDGIASAMKRGDLRSAWAIIAAAWEVAWAQAKASFFSIWGEVRDSFLGQWELVTETIGALFADAIGSLAPLFGPMMAQITAAMRLTMALSKLVSDVTTGALERQWSIARRLSETPLLKYSAQAGAFRALANALMPRAAENTGGAVENAIQKAKATVDAANEARDVARAEDRARRDEDVKAARARLQALLDEERKRAGVGRFGEAAGPGGGPSLTQAAREVRGNFASFGSSAAAQQAFAVGSTPIQRQLVGIGEKQVQILERIEGKIEPGVFG